MDMVDSNITEGNAVSGCDEGDALGRPLWVNSMKSTFPIWCGSLGAYYIYDLPEFIHIVQLICLATSSSEPFFITNRYFTNLLSCAYHYWPKIYLINLIWASFNIRVDWSWGTWWRSWLRHCATTLKVPGSIPDGIIGIFHWRNPSICTMTLGLTHPVTEMSTRNISWR
jgi:hypothetical protein